MSDGLLQLRVVGIARLLLRCEERLDHPHSISDDIFILGFRIFFEDTALYGLAFKEYETRVHHHSSRAPTSELDSLIEVIRHECGNDFCIKLILEV